MLVLSFESSCDETSVAVVDMSENGRKILSNQIATQVEVHKLYGGVVPEIASRAHTEAISSLTYAALEESGKSMEEIDIIAVTNRPGLIGALLVAVSFAKSLAYSYNKPLVPVNHIKGHVAANYLEFPQLEPPFVALVVSGGHTSLINVKSYTDYETIGRTRDDAAGEAFDKVGRRLGLCYPCGKDFDILASKGDKNYMKFPSAAVSGDTLDFSFSGLKTSAINYINSLKMKDEKLPLEDICASYTAVVVDSLLKRVDSAVKMLGYKNIVLAGGVAANSHLQKALEDYAKKKKLTFYHPSNHLCGDNGAMIGAQGYYEYLEGNVGDESLNAYCTHRDFTLKK